MGFGDMKNMMGQLMQAQKQMKKMQKELEKLRFEAQTGGGMVTAVVNGEFTLVDLKIDSSKLQADELKVLPKLILNTVQEAQKRAKAEVAKKAKDLSGLNIPGFG